MGLIVRARPMLMCLVWALVLLDIALHAPALSRLAAAGLVLYVALSLRGARRETLVIFSCVTLAVVALVYVGALAESVVAGVERALLFAALLPTLRTTRAAIRRLGAVVRARERLAALPERWGDVGVTLGSHVFGSMLNTGAFAIMSTVVPEQAPPRRRLRAAEASLRGMNTAILWSPFFVGYAVAATYLPSVRPWEIAALGLAMAACVVGIGLSMFTRPMEPRAVGAALGCLAPILPGMAIAGGAVVACGSLTRLSTLEAVLVMMPLLAGLAVAGGGASPREVVHETREGLGRMGDDMLLIVAAMTLGTVAEASEELRAVLDPLLGGAMPPGATLALLTFSILLPAMAGVHPMITGTVVLAALTGVGHGVSDLVLMEAMLVGWGFGSMVSISSLSVVTAGAMYDTAPLRLAYSRNLAYVLVAATVAVAALTAVDALL